MVLIRHKVRKSTQTQEKVSGRLILRMMFSISGVMFLFGLTWLFAILTFSSITGLRETFQLLFTVFNSLQGFFIFIFILNVEALAFWKKVCGCGSKQPSSRSTTGKRTQGTGVGYSSRDRAGTDAFRLRALSSSSEAEKKPLKQGRKVSTLSESLSEVVTTETFKSERKVSTLSENEEVAFETFKYERKVSTVTEKHSKAGPKVNVEKTSANVLTYIN